MKGFLASKSRADQIVRRWLASILCFSILLTAGVCFVSSGRSAYADEYKEPIVRVGIVLRDEGRKSYSLSASGGFSFGYMNKSTDEFTSLGTTAEKSLTSSLDDSHYLEVAGFSLGGKDYLPSDPQALDALKQFFGGYGLVPFLSYHDGLCFRMGSFSTASAAKECLDTVLADIQSANDTGEEIILPLTVVSPLSSSVIIKSGSTPVISFASSNAALAVAVQALQSGSKPTYMSAGSSE